MANYKVIHDRVSKGRGKAAQRVGQPFELFRLQDRGFVQVLPRINCLIRRIRGGPDLEQQFFASQVFELVIDARRLKVGDFLREQQSARHAQQIYPALIIDADVGLSGVGGVQQSYSPIYYVAHLRPVHKFIGVRMDRLCQVRRGLYPNNNGDGGYQDQGEATEQVLWLQSGFGEYTWKDVEEVIDNPLEQEPALIPFQMEPAIAKGVPAFNLPTDWPLSKWFFTCPGNWKGLTLRENDVVIAPDGHRYRVLSTFDSKIGPEILQGICERVES